MLSELDKNTLTSHLRLTIEEKKKTIVTARNKYYGSINQVNENKVAAGQFLNGFIKETDSANLDIINTFDEQQLMELISFLINLNMFDSFNYYAVCNICEKEVLFPTNSENTDNYNSGKDKPEDWVFPGFCTEHLPGQYYPKEKNWEENLGNIIIPKQEPEATECDYIIYKKNSHEKMSFKPSLFDSLVNDLGFYVNAIKKGQFQILKHEEELEKIEMELTGTKKGYKLTTDIFCDMLIKLLS